MKSVQIWTSTAALMALAAVAGCSGTKAAAKGATDPSQVASSAAKSGSASGSSGASGAGATSSTATEPGVASQGVHVSDEIARACNLAQPKATPRFSFDSTAIPDDDRDLLAAVAKCLSEGALRSRDVELIGRADARGENEYNMGLGEARASSVKRFLSDLGVAEARLMATSRGELDAKGIDEDGWAEDRRVDIELRSN